MMPRSSSVRLGAVAVALGALLTGCSSDGPVPTCENCEIWSQLTEGLGRFPTPHPVNGDILAFSTIDKTPGAPDADRQGDEDIWLTWIVNEDDPAANPVWQLTDDALGMGGNLVPRWSPLGVQIAFIHVDDSGEYQIWRMPVTPPASPTVPPVLGTPEIIVADARDPAWLTENVLVFTRDDKLFRVDVPASGPPASPPVQFSFNPPVYATSEQFVDRQPDVAPADADEGVFNTLGRQNVADVFVEAFEIDNEVGPPDTTETMVAYISLARPDGSVSYPLFEGADTLRTPSLLQSLPVGDGGDFGVGVRLDSRLLADSLQENYCDTLLVQTVRLDPSDSDTVSHYFEVARGTLALTSDLGNTAFSWTRQDGRVDNLDFPINPIVVNAGELKIYECLLSYEVANGVPAPPTLEPYLITATRAGEPPFATSVTITPGDTTFVTMYPQPEAERIRQQGRDPHGRAAVFASASGASIPQDSPGALGLGRAEGDLSTLWRMDLSNPALPAFVEIVGTPVQAQAPAISEDFGGTRYLAWTELNSDNRWDLKIQRLVNWQPDGAPVEVPTPGTFDNLSCTRSIFHPRFLPDSQAGAVHVAVTLTACPDNGFPDLGPDDDPWSVGELRIWSVRVAVP